MKSLNSFWLDKQVLLTDHDGHKLLGRITKITDRFVVFETKNKTSVLSIRFIKKIVSKNKEFLQDCPIVKTKHRISDATVASRNVLTKRKPKRSNNFRYSQWWKRENVEEVEK